jgi:hypothetical protein
MGHERGNLGGSAALDDTDPIVSYLVNDRPFDTTIASEIGSRACGPAGDRPARDDPDRQRKLKDALSTTCRGGATSARCALLDPLLKYRR